MQIILPFIPLKNEDWITFRGESCNLSLFTFVKCSFFSSCLCLSKRKKAFHNLYEDIHHRSFLLFLLFFPNVKRKTFLLRFIDSEHKKSSKDHKNWKLMLSWFSFLPTSTAEWIHHHKNKARKLAYVCMW